MLSSDAIFLHGNDLELSSSSSSSTAGMKEDVNPFSAARWAAVANLPEVLAPSRWLATPESDARIARIQEAIEHKMRTNPKALPLMIRLTCDRRTGFVTGANEWGVDPTGGIRPEDPSNAELRFATDEEEEEARRKLGIEIEPPWVPDPRPFYNIAKRRRVGSPPHSPIDHRATPPRQPPTARGQFDPDISNEYFPPSFPSHLVTSTPVLGRIRPASIPPASPDFFDPSSPFSSPPSSSQRVPTRKEHLNKDNDQSHELSITPKKQGNIMANLSQLPGFSGSQTSSVYTSQTSLIEGIDPGISPSQRAARGLGRLPTLDDLLSSAKKKKTPGRRKHIEAGAKKRKTEITAHGGSSTVTQRNNAAMDLADKAESGAPQLAPRPSSVSSSSTASSAHRAYGREMDGPPALKLVSDSNLSTPAPSPLAEKTKGGIQRSAEPPAPIRFNSLEATQRLAGTRASPRPGGFSSSLSGVGAYQSQFDIDRTVEKLGDFAEADVFGF